MEFLYSLNRLNVATSRAKCAVFLVASRRLLDPDCKHAAADEAGECVVQVQGDGWSIAV
jgi:hypothetical protein